MTLKVIGAGFGRTGTRSMKAALEQLGYDPCYHMGEVWIPIPGRNEGHLDAWHDFFVQGKAMDWRWLLENYQACVDMPTCFYYSELMQAFPDALVILNTREPDKWFDSWQHLCSALDQVNDPDKIVRLEKFLPMVNAMREQYFGDPIERETCIAAFKAHTEAVRRDVPADRLLEFSVKEGWGPLCRFLGVEVPDSPFPHLNEREGVVDGLKRALWTTEPLTY